jgi:thiosulfate/3-mercaptopyruvate sulfurtransferase
VEPPVLPPIVDPSWVVEHRPNLILGDVRWYLDGRSGLEAFTKSHIPGAIFVDLDHDLSGPGPATEGRHPLPAPDAFAAALGALGIGEDDAVVAYDDSGGGSAGRLVWMLRVLGRPAALLNGGLAGWPGPLASGDTATRSPVMVAVRPWPAERFTDHDGVAVAAASDRAVVLDARSAERYRGEHESIDPRPGHIPGARSAPWAANFDATKKTLLPDMDLRARYRSLGVDRDTEVVCYCGSGVSACADLLTLERLGVTRTRLFVPSWSGWSADPGRPVALGDE